VHTEGNHRFLKKTDSVAQRYENKMESVLAEFASRKKKIDEEIKAIKQAKKLTINTHAPSKPSLGENSD
jgi:glycyl-tRNA synthetase beta subunit